VIEHNGCAARAASSFASEEALEGVAR